MINDQARKFVRANKDRPFFLYCPTTVPHLALQVPDDSLAEYRGKFPEKPYTGGKGYLPQQTPRAAYAAMVTRMDGEVGRLAELIDELGLAEQTIFIFTSDNGPTYDNIGGSDSDFFDSAGRLRGLKGSLYEGGVRAPTIVRWPGHVAAGSTSDRVAGFEDFLPTILELIGAKAATPAGLDGISFAPTLLGHEQPERPFLYREFPSYGGQQSVRVGPWKAIRQDLKPRKGQPVVRTELYNLAEDEGETKDVAAAHPDVVARLEGIMQAQHAPSAVFPMPAIDGSSKP